MDYLVYTRDTLRYRAHTEAEAVALAERERAAWQTQGSRVPPVKVCYNGRHSITVWQDGEAVAWPDQLAQWRERLPRERKGAGVV